MKKFLSVFLIAVMLLCTGIPACAKNAFYPVTYDVQTPSTISAGEEFTISIGVDKMKNLALSGRIDISFDTYALKYISSKGIGDNVDSDDFYQTSPFGSTVNDTQPGKVIIAYYSYDVCPEDYVKIIEIKFRAMSSENTDISIATVDLTVEIDGVEYFWDSGSGAQIHTLSVTQGTSKPAQKIITGDVNGDEKITAADARLTLRTSAKIDTFNAEQQKAADVNFDNKITAADARMILRVSAKIDSFDIDDTHDYEVTEIQKKNCVTDGIIEYRCSECGYSYQDVIKATGHDITVEKGRKPTCTDIGWEEYETCSKCDYSTYKEIAARHDFDEGTCIRPAQCRKCFETSGEVLGHTTDDGICDRCGEKITKKQDEIDEENELHENNIVQIKAMFDANISVKMDTLESLMYQNGIYTLYSKTYYESRYNDLFTQYNNLMVKAAYSSGSAAQSYKKQAQQVYSQMQTIRVAMECAELYDEIEYIEAQKRIMISAENDRHEKSLKAIEDKYEN